MDASTPATQAFSLDEPRGDPRPSPLDDTPAGPVDDAPASSVQDTVRHSPDSEQPRQESTAGPSSPPRPTGPNATAIVVGVIAVVLSGLIIATETTNLDIDWSGKWPGVIVGIGVLFVALGAIGLVRRHDDA